MVNKNYFVTGFTELLFLSILRKGDAYVYDIMKMIEDFSGGKLVISPNTIYTSAYKLENDNIITEYSKLVGRKRRRVYYHLEPKGFSYLESLEEQYRQAYDGITSFLGHLEKLEGWEVEPDGQDDKALYSEIEVTLSSDEEGREGVHQVVEPQYS